jgi:hypothetical protein
MWNAAMPIILQPADVQLHIGESVVQLAAAGRWIWGSMVRIAPGMTSFHERGVVAPLGKGALRRATIYHRSRRSMVGTLPLCRPCDSTSD